MRCAALAALLILLGGCQLSVPLAAAGLGALTATENLDTETLKAYIEWRESKATVAVPK